MGSGADPAESETGCAQVAERLMAADCKSAAPCELRRFESSPVHHTMPESGYTNAYTFGRKRLMGLALLAAVACLAWFTMEPGKLRTLVVILMAGFALRLLLVHQSSASISGDNSR
jgi:hypothetical protein